MSGNMHELRVSAAILSTEFFHWVYRKYIDGDNMQRSIAITARAYGVVLFDRMMAREARK